MLTSKALVGALAAIVLVVGGYGGYRVWRHVQNTSPQPAPSTAVVIGPPSAAPSAPPAATPTAAPTPIPASVLIRVPYTSQSPYAVWKDGDPHEEYCEAAALLMAADYFRGDTRATIPPAEADAAMGHIVEVERQDFPGVLDLPLTDIGTVGTQQFGLRPAVAPVDLDVIEQNLAQGLPVIVPVMTRGVNGQPLSEHFGSGSVYHVVLLIGYDRQRGVLFANDAGFMEGEHWQYSWTALSTAIGTQATKYPQGRVMLTFQKAA